MRHLVIALLSAAVFALLPASAWALPFAGVARGVCEPLAVASVGDAVGAGEGDLVTSCDLVLVPDEIDVTRGWAPLCDPSGASGAERVPVYDARPASLTSGACDGPDALKGAMVRGDDAPPSSASDGADLGRTLAPAATLVPVRLGAPVADRFGTAEVARPGFSLGVYRPPHD